MSLAAYLPADRYYAIQRGVALPDRSSGAALFADISGFTSFTEALARELGARRGAEELTRQLNRVYDALIATVDGYGGSVINFAGDAITCWFDDQEMRDGRWEMGTTVPSPIPHLSSPIRAATCALAMQEAMRAFATVTTPAGSVVALAMKAAVATGPARRFLVGNPRIQLLDVLAGATLDRMAAAEQQATRGEVVIDSATAAALGDVAIIAEWREDDSSGERFAVLSKLQIADFRLQIDPMETAQSAIYNLQSEMVRSWLLPPVYERLHAGQGAYLAELRPAVALFVGFGGIDYDAEDDAGVRLDVYVRWVQGILARYDAYVLQLTMGDKGGYLYAAFGAPLAHDDDPARAVAAALEIAAPPHVISIQGVRLGLSRGRMRTGDYGGATRRTYGVLGDEVNLAARLMAKAQPGQILVSQAVARTVEQIYQLDPIGEIRVKGKQEPVVVAAVRGRRAPDQAHTSALFAEPLVGRERELAQLEQWLGEAPAGQGRVLHLEGAAGIGKSHLAATMAERARQRGMRVVIGVCQIVDQQRSYAVWNDIFRSLFELAGEDSDPAAKVAARVVAANPDWLVRLPLLADLLDLPIPDNATTAAFDPRLRQEALFALVLALVQLWARAQPLLLMIEDAHWMDEASVGLTLALARVLATQPIALALVQRPSPRQDQAIVLELSRLPVYRLLELSDLSPGGIAALASNRLAGPLDLLTLDLIQAQANGNPFFAEELIDALRESGALELGDGRWRLAPVLVDALRNAECLTRDPASGEWRLAVNAQLATLSLGIPDSVHGVVLSRIDRLPEAHRLTLKVASVIGQLFEVALLSRCHPAQLERDALLEQIALLEVRDFTRLEQPLPRPSYMFKHGITQEVAYETLLEAQQQALHQAVGAVLEELAPEAVERLAYHYRRGGAREKALFYLDQAARKAQREYANETALRYYRDALEFEERWQWRQGQAETLHILGRRDEERAALEGLAAAPNVPVFTIAYLWGQYYEALGDYPAAQAAVERALEAGQAQADRLGVMRCLAQLGLIARRQGDYERAKQRYQEALALVPGEVFHSDAEGQALVQALNGLGSVQRQQGDFDAARTAYERAVAVSMLIGDRRGEAHALDNLGTVAYHQRHFAEALPNYMGALEIRRMIGDRAGEGTSLLNLAQAIRDSGDYGQAQEYLLAALGIQQATGNRWEEVNVWNDLGILYQELGDLLHAQECLQTGMELCQNIGDEAGRAYLLSNLGLVIRDSGDLLTAEKTFLEGLSLAQAQSDTYLAATFLSYLGVVSLWQGDHEQAIVRASNALQTRRELDMRVRTTGDLATLALAMLPTGQIEQALAYAHEVLAILEACGGEGPEFPQQDYFSCSQVLAVAGQTDAAQAALQLAYALVMVRADKISDPELRRSFLEQVTINREIVQQATRSPPHRDESFSGPNQGQEHAAS